jgi:chorismate--pyruvate lyase
MGWQARTPARGGLRRWLQASGSLSARLAATGETFGVQVLAQGREPLTPDESRALGQGRRRMGYAREVLLRVDGQPLVFARSVTAHADSLGAWRAVRGLGHRPLADVLFRRSGILRAPLAYSQFQRQSRMQRHVASSWQAATGLTLAHQALPARRSVFTRQGAALLVMEVFAAPANGWSWPQAAPRKTFKQRT